MRVFLDPALDVVRTIYKARAEEFIHIFVHQKAKLIEFLEHMVQVTWQFERVVFHGSALVADGHIALRNQNTVLSESRKHTISSKFRKKSLADLTLKTIEFMIDRRSYAHNLAVVKLKAEKNSGLNGIRTHDLCDTDAVLYQLSRLGAGHFESS